MSTNNLRVTSLDQTSSNFNMSTAARIVQTVRAHVPLIKFRNGKGKADVNPFDIMKAVSQELTISQPTPNNTASNLPKVGSTPRGSAVIEDFDLPAKYQRKLISEEEIAFIERGGPE